MRKLTEVYRMLHGEDSNVVLDLSQSSPDVELPMYPCLRINHLRTVSIRLMGVRQIVVTLPYVILELGIYVYCSARSWSPGHLALQDI